MCGPPARQAAFANHYLKFNGRVARLNSHCRVRHQGPEKSPALQTRREQTHCLAVVSVAFDQIAAAQQKRKRCSNGECASMVPGELVRDHQIYCACPCAASQAARIRPSTSRSERSEKAWVQKP